VPLLWILPLSLYLLTFVIVFSRRPLIPVSWMTRAAPHVLVVVAVPIFWGLRLPGLIGIITHLIVLFTIGMVGHGQLAQRRPPPSQLTEFFVWVAVGGLVGGSFTALIAPVVFNRVYEYPIILALSGMLLPAVVRDSRLKPADILLPVVVGSLLLLLTRNIRPLPGAFAFVLTILFGVALFSFRGRPLRFGLALAAVFGAGLVRESLGANRSTVLDAERSFFGVYRVARDAEANLILLYHGTTLHGAQSLDAARRLTPLTYYHPNGPAGDVFADAPAAIKPARAVAIVGLGAGSLACYGHRGEHWTFFEIDPVIAHIALDPRLFTFLRDCPPSVHIVLGDARLTLARSPASSFDILVLDAFSSDAIPVHLLTLEAFRGYLRVLAPHGVIAVHISNEHLDLEPVVAELSRQLNLASLVRRDLHISEADASKGRAQAVWAILARSSADLGGLNALAQWKPLRHRADVGVWTDDFSNIIRVFAWR
jgi:hypothetical protein